MTQRFDIHPENPQPRLIRQVAYRFHDGDLGVYPTDSCYAFGFLLGNPQPALQIARIRQAGKDHNFTVVCRDLSEIATYAKIDNATYRLLKAHTPGPYTFILRATRDVPRRLQNPKKKTVGIRIPDNPIVQAIVRELGHPLVTTSANLSGEETPQDPRDIDQELGRMVDMVVDGGILMAEGSSVISLVDDRAEILRQGSGDTSWIEQV